MKSDKQRAISLTRREAFHLSEWLSGESGTGGTVGGPPGVMLRVS
jgi:hypothetical protein